MIDMLLKTTALFLLFFVWGNKIQAQQWHLKQYTVDNGLPSNEIYHIGQDHDNNLILATDRGVARFDGYRFENVPVAQKRTSTPVYYLKKTASGRIFFSGTQGKLYEYAGKHLAEFVFNDTLSSLYQHSGLYIANTIAESGDTLWISYNNDFNYHLRVGSCYITKAGAIKKWQEPDGLYFDLRKNFHYRQLNDSLWHEFQQVHIRWPDGTGQTDKVRLDWQSGYIRRLFHLEVDGYDLFCMGRKLLVYRNRQKVGEYAFDGNVLHLASLEKGSIAVGFERGGARVYAIRGGRLLPSGAAILPYFSVSFIYKDHQGGVWFSTQESGLFYRYPAPARVWDHPEMIRSLTPIGGRVAVGFPSGKVEWYGQGRRDSTFTLPMAPRNQFMGFVQNYDSTLVFRTEQGFYKHEKGRWRLYPGNDFLLLPVAPGEVYGSIAGRAELNRYAAMGGPLLSKVTLPKRIVSMHYDRRRRLWLGTLEGLFLWEQGRLHNLSGKNEVFADRIIAIREMDNGDVVVAGLSSGIALVREKGIETVQNRHGLPVSFINVMQVSGSHIWLGTNQGLIRLDVGRAPYRIRQYGMESGLPTLNIQDFAIAGGWLYLRWLNRVAALPLDLFHQPLRLDRVRLSRLYVQGQPLPQLPFQPLAPDQNDIEFHFNSINLAGAHTQQYTYQLAGYDQKWHMTREQFARYTNLPPGTYRFRVHASLEGGAFATPESEYRFSIARAFYQQWWFYLLVTGLAALSLLLLFRYRMGSVKRKNQLLLDLAESRQQALVQLINPHFAFNVLNTIQGTILRQDKIYSASLLAQFAKLMRLAMEMGKEKYVLLQREEAFLEKYFQLELLRAPGKFSYAIQLDPGVVDSDLYIPTMLLQPFVENSIKHGFMHLPHPGFLRLRFYQDGRKTLFCLIDDNGVGRRVSAAINLKGSEGHQSSGIEITLNRLQLLHQQNKTPYYYNVIDKEDDQGRAQGTTTILSIPYKNKL